MHALARLQQEIHILKGSIEYIKESESQAVEEIYTWDRS
ncbi:unnamed protein product [Brassica oleracea]